VIIQTESGDSFMLESEQMWFPVYITWRFWTEYVGNKTKSCSSKIIKINTWIVCGMIYVDIITCRGDYKRGVDWWMVLLTTYIHDSELQAITAPSLIPTIHKSPQHPLNLFQPAVYSPTVPWQRLLTVEILRLHALRFYFNNWLCFLLITSRHGPPRNTAFPTVTLLLRAYSLPRECVYRAVAQKWSLLTVTA
jgi:hypothetical protein